MALDDNKKAALIYQTAVNLVDMVDADSQITVLTRNLDLGAGVLPYNFSGVEVTPYIAEVETAIKTNNASMAFVPNVDGTLPATWNARPRGDTLYFDADFSTSYTPGDAAWVENSTPADTTYNAATDIVLAGAPVDGVTTGVTLHTSNNPPTGWGKYIKLVNPWDVPITLTNYSVVIRAETPVGTSRLRKWVFGAATGQWSSAALPALSDIVIAFPAGEVIPARGHYMIVDCVQAYPAVAALPVTQWCEVPAINYMQEADDGIADGQTAPSSSDEFEGLAAHGPTVVELCTPAPATLVMRFDVQENAAVEDDDDVFTAAPNTSTQIGDPRPCWIRPVSAVFCTDPWQMGAANVVERTVDNADLSGGVCSVAWFNRGDLWRKDAGASVASGDQWKLISGPDVSPPPDTGTDADNVLASFPPAIGETDPDIAGWYSGVTGHQLVVMNAGQFHSPGDLGFVHSGIEWGTVSIGCPANAADFGARDIVYLRNFPDCLTGALNPFSDGIDNDGDTSVSQPNHWDSNDRGSATDDPEIKTFGKINVNSASGAVLRAVFKNAWFTEMWLGPSNRAQALAADIVAERLNGPFSSVDDLFERVPSLFGVDLDCDDANDTGAPNSFRREALARFMYNLVTVRSDTWGVVGLAKSKNTGVEQRFYFVLDRSSDPVRVIFEHPDYE